MGFLVAFLLNALGCAVNFAYFAGNGSRLNLGVGIFAGFSALLMLELIVAE